MDSWWQAPLKQVIAVSCTALLLAQVPVAGWAADPTAGWSPKQRLRAITPAPGALISVPGMRGHQHLWCRGPEPTGGKPTVVVISGAGDFSLSWRRAQADLSRSHRVCTYDRAGLGWSSPAHRPRTGRHVVAELGRLLRAGGVSGPLVIVGHSMGGIYARMFTAAHPRRVKGVVLVDPGDERLDVTIPEPAHAALAAGVRAATRAQMGGGRTCATGAYARVLRLLPLSSALSPRDARIDRRLQAAWCRTWRAAAAEGRGAFRTWAQARRLDLGKGSLGRRPLSVLVSDADLQFVSDPALNRQIVQRWRELQHHQALLSTRGRFRVAAHTSHAVMCDRPALVAATIRRIANRAGSTESPTPTGRAS